MAEAASSILDALYRRLILRDVFGKIVPGFVVLSSLAIRLDAPNGLGDLGAHSKGAAWIVAAGVSWLTALAIQSIGETLGILRFWPKDLDATGPRYEARIRFGRAATEDEKQQAERFALIAEAAGLTACACGIVILVGLSLLIAPVSNPQNPARDMSYWIGQALLGVTAWGLWQLHRSHVGKRYVFIQQVLATQDGATLAGAAGPGSGAATVSKS